jgi:hypothetical protein
MSNSRALQFNSNPSRVLYIKKEAEHVFLQQLDMAVNMSMSLEHIYQLETNQSAIALFSGRCLIKIPDKHLKKEMNLNNLAKVICATLLDSKYTFQGGDIIHNLTNTPSMLKQVDDLVKHILFKDIGRISRALSKLIIILYTQKEYTFIGHLLNR